MDDDRSMASAASPILFGRAPESASIMAFLSRESQADVGAIILGGDPGVGKSALLDEAARSAFARGYAVIRTGSPPSGLATRRHSKSLSASARRRPRTPAFSARRSSRP